MRPGIARHTVAVVAIRPAQGATPCTSLVQHRFRDPQTAFARGERLIKNEGTPAPRPRPAVLPGEGWLRRYLPVEADSVEDVQGYIGSTLGDSSKNLCYEVDAEQAFARQPLGIPESAAIRA
jgi:hypothetical protein